MKVQPVGIVEKIWERLSIFILVNTFVFNANTHIHVFIAVLNAS